jgi:hypothetical protein
VHHDAPPHTRPTFTFGNAKTLNGGLVGLRSGPATLRAWDITPDDERFIMLDRGDQPQDATTNQINFVLNWFEELKSHFAATKP